MKKPNIRVVIALIIIIAIFIAGLVIALVCRFNKDSTQSNTESLNSINYTSSNLVNESIDEPINSEISNSTESSNSTIASSNNTTESSKNNSTEANTTSSDVIPDIIRPTIDITMADIDYAGMDNLTAAQNTPATRIKLAQMITDATSGKTVDYVQILNTSKDNRVLIDIYFKNGTVINYSVLFDNLNTFNFTRCITTETYEYIMNGGNLG